MANRKVVFLDRDGVINRNREEYVLDVSEFEFLPGAKEALKLLKENGYDIHIISNQSCVNRGLLPMKTLDAITEHMIEGVRKSGGDIDSVNYCPAHPDENSPRRKPEIGMLQDVIDKFGYNPGDIWFVGDRRSDMIAGNNFGCRTIFVGADDYLSTLKKENNEIPDYSATDIYEAVTEIIIPDGE